MKTFDLECPECGDVARSQKWEMCRGVKGKRHKPIAMYRVMDWGEYSRPEELSREQFVENKGKTERDKLKNNVLLEPKSDLAILPLPEVGL